MTPQVDEHVLHDILRGAALPEHLQRGPVHGRPETVEGLGERTIVTGRQARRQQPVSPSTRRTLAGAADTGQRARAVRRPGSARPDQHRQPQVS
jgi:hypothetical protein